MSQIVQMTDVAKDYLDGVRPDDGHITLTINGGGCSGFTYKWGTTDEWTEKDVGGDWIEVENILLVDPVCEMYILGSTIDYNKSIEIDPNHQIAIKNKKTLLKKHPEPKKLKP